MAPRVSVSAVRPCHPLAPPPTPPPAPPPPGAGGGGGGAVGWVLGVFGAWAVLSGAAQLVVGLRRRGPVLGKQWPTLISGGLSFLVGLTYLAQATGDTPALRVLSVYATGGGVFFIVQAALLAWKSHQRAATR